MQTACIRSYGSLYHYRRLLFQVYQFTFHQEQLAKLTPSELIEVAFMSSLLEQHPYSPHKQLSQRFEALRTFLEQVVKVVPVESLFHAINHCPDHRLASQICNALQVSNFKCPYSLEAHIAIDNAIHFMISKQKEYSDSTLSDVVAHQFKRSNTSKLIAGKKRRQRTAEQIFNQQYRDSMHSRDKQVSTLGANDRQLSTCISYLCDMESAIALDLKTNNLKRRSILCGLTMDCAYSNISSNLKPPLKVLKEGRQQLLHLTKYTTDDSLLTGNTESKGKLSELFNSKLLEVVNTIRRGDLKICTLLLGAFMEEKMLVPLMKSSLDTAKAIHLVTSAAAVGVWALFSVGYGDMRYLLNVIPSGSVLVDVADYIKGIFKQESIMADKKYAGKLQFMVQAMKETVSCNSHYVSYSLECQLIELCGKLNICDSTSLPILIQEWDTIFKDNVLSVVTPIYRPLIACWLKWALMIHHLREELARYTTVGVVGLVNSGKSLLVSTLFGIKVRSLQVQNSLNIYILH